MKELLKRSEMFGNERSVPQPIQNSYSTDQEEQVMGFLFMGGKMTTFGVTPTNRKYTTHSFGVESTRYTVSKVTRF